MSSEGLRQREVCVRGRDWGQTSLCQRELRSSKYQRDLQHGVAICSICNCCHRAGDCAALTYRNYRDRIAGGASCRTRAEHKFGHVHWLG